jgi:hypothetical protein
MAAAVDGSAEQFKVDTEAALFDVGPVRGDWPYDVSADGQRFLVNTLIVQSTSTPLRVVVNWTAGLKK